MTTPQKPTTPGPMAPGTGTGITTTTTATN